jgi:hypothetical protein
MGALSSLASIGLNLALAQQASQRQSSDVNAERDRQIRAIRQRDEEERRQQQEELRRRLATQRARAGAAGVGGGGSADAVLRGLIEEADATEQARAAASGLRISDIRRSASRSRQNNLLELAGGAGSSALSALGRRSGSLISLLDR